MRAARCDICDVVVSDEALLHPLHDPDCDREPLGFCRCDGLWCHPECCPECAP